VLSGHAVMVGGFYLVDIFACLSHLFLHNLSRAIALEKRGREERKLNHGYWRREESMCDWGFWIRGFMDRQGLA